MKICRTQKEFEYWKEHYAEMYGGILVNARLKIIYTPEDKLYQKKYLNRTVKRGKEKKYAAGVDFVKKMTVYLTVA